MSSAARSSLLAALLLMPLATWPQQSVDEFAQEGPPEAGAGATGEEGVRAVGGTSVIGNREVPKSLYIVPWKNSEVGVRTDLSRDLLDEGLQPVDPPEFRRQVQYHEFHQQKQ